VTFLTFLKIINPTFLYIYDADQEQEQDSGNKDSYQQEAALPVYA